MYNNYDQQNVSVRIRIKGKVETYEVPNYDVMMM